MESLKVIIATILHGLICNPYYFLAEEHQISNKKKSSFNDQQLDKTFLYPNFLRHNKKVNLATY